MADITDALLRQEPEVRAGLAQRGFAIAREVISAAAIEGMRDRWVSHIRTTRARRRFVRGNLVLGEPNFLSYSKIAEWCMYRHFDFPWNSATDDETTRVCDEIHRFRNRLQGFAPDFGTTYNARNYGTYVSTSLYPPGDGMLEMHVDGHGDVPILHFMMPLTFKGEHYRKGGLMIVDTAGVTHDVDADCRPGDLIFFDGRCRHGVEVIEGDQGRLAVFAIPTFFVPAWKGAVALRSFRIWRTELKSRVAALVGAPRGRAPTGGKSATPG